MLLSPLAKPFNPSPHGMMDTSGLAIYNDGVPSLVPADTKGSDEMVHGISDDAIDNCFPPTAQEVSEIEACEIFVEMMAIYSLMEEAEEKARVEGDLTVLHHKKRWAARRVDGLLGKPYPARNLYNFTDGQHDKLGTDNNHNSHDDEESLVTYDHNLHRKQMQMANLEKRIRAKELYKINKHSQDKKLTSLRGRKPIQQPRKQF